MAKADADAKVYATEDFADRASRSSCWVAIGDHVYDVTEFLDEHPGGDDVILEEAGTDATEKFEEIGHSLAARDMLKKYVVGKFKVGRSVEGCATATPSRGGDGVPCLLWSLPPA
eukprot:evm.model.scf_1685.1 EVM.evm.TU.scf_1685.1   scf_1685:318-792(-)